MTDPEPAIPSEAIERRIYSIRGFRVILDHDLADLYGVETKALNQAVTRNKSRFPEDFMFRLTNQELSALRSQSVTGSQKHRDPRYPPRVFTQEGVAMLSGVLRSQRAIQVNIAIMRAFVRMREAMLSHEEMARRLDYLESKYDSQFETVFEALRALMTPPDPPKNPIGFIHHSEDE